MNLRATRHTASKLLLAPFLALLITACGQNHGDDARNDTHDHDTREAVANDEARATAGGEREILYWHDPMHPQTRFDRPGRSPFMDMDLVPVYADEVGEAGEVRVGADIVRAMNIRTASVERGRLWRRIDTVGHIGIDQSRLHHLHPRTSGWVEEVHVHAVGDAIRKGQKLFTFYSPELVNAQEEFLHALRRGDTAMARAGRDKLRAFDVQPEVIAELERRRSVQRSLPWHAQHDGVVTQLGIRHGMYATPDQLFLETADLSRLWVTAEVFDRQAAWLSPDQPAEIRLNHAPGETLDSRVAYIYPQQDPVTRSTRVRLLLDNPAGTLRPGMWSKVTIFGGAQDDLTIIPREALISTGHEHRVVLRTDEERFEVRSVIPGMESGDFVAIHEGVEAGERVVVSGQFLLDSEASRRGGDRRMEDDHAHH